ncbi:hypothetical protein JXI42_11135 [bacterium]|nr:hypothetical protein [bacterium]
MYFKASVIKKGFLFSVSLAAILLTLVILSCGKKDKSVIVNQAYELRLSGVVDSAKVVLEGALAENPNSSLALFEMARLKHHMGLGDPQGFFETIDEIEQTLQKAIDNDPDNVVILFYDAYFSFLAAYALLVEEQPGLQEKVQGVVSNFEAVLALQPDYSEAMLYIVEILSLPAQMGGNMTKAGEYVVKLGEIDPVLGAKGQELLLDPEVDRVEFWEKILETNPESAEAMDMLGKAYLYNEDLDKGRDYLEKAMEKGPGKTQLLLDLARFFLITAMRDSTMEDSALPIAEDYVNRYIDTSPINPLKAFATAIYAQIKHGQGNDDIARELGEEALILDPYFSKAFAVPPMVLYSKPDEVCHYHSYFFRPF